MEAGIDTAVEFADTHLGVDPHTQYQKESEKGAAGGYASLDGSGKVPSAQIPDIAITEFLGVAANQAAMLGAAGQKGDWVIRSDENKVYVITGSDPTQIGSWTALAYPADAVVSVNGETGVVSLSAADVGAEPAGAVTTHESTYDHTNIPDPTGATEQYVWTADGAGNATWQPGGAGAPTDSYWKFSTSTVDADPGTGKFRLNNATRAGATFIYLDDFSTPGLDVSNFAVLLAVGDQVFIQPKTDATSTVRYTVTGAATDGTGYWKVPVSVSVAPAGPEISNNADALLLWSIAALGGTPSTHIHDDRYYTESETDTLLASKPDFSYGATPPGSPTVGDRWVDAETGFEYIWVNDGTSTQWVMTDMSGGGGATSHGELADLGVDDHTQYHTDARGDARYVQLGLVDAKGDIIVATADNTVTRLPVGGTNGHVLTVDSAEAAGVKWAAAAGGVTRPTGATAQAFVPGWTYPEPTMGVDGAAPLSPFAVVGTAGYIVSDGIYYRATSASGEAAVMLGAASGLTSSVSLLYVEGTVTVKPTEGSGRAGIAIMCGASMASLGNVRLFQTSDGKVSLTLRTGAGEVTIGTSSATLTSPLLAISMVGNVATTVYDDGTNRGGWSVFVATASYPRPAHAYIKDSTVGRVAAGPVKG
jgi:hypothetical protein